MASTTKSRSDLLKAAAKQIALEESFQSADAIILASEEISQERGFASPRKARPNPMDYQPEATREIELVRTDGSSSLESPRRLVDARKENVDGNASVGLPSSVTSIMEDSNALISQLGGTGQPVPILKPTNDSIEADVLAFQKAVSADPRLANQQISNSNDAAGTKSSQTLSKTYKRYVQRSRRSTSAGTNRNRASEGPGLEGFAMQLRDSRAAVFFENMDRRDSSGSVASSTVGTLLDSKWSSVTSKSKNNNININSATAEVLFRNMKQIVGPCEKIKTKRSAWEDRRLALTTPSMNIAAKAEQKEERVKVSHVEHKALVGEATERLSRAHGGSNSSYQASAKPFRCQRTEEQRQQQFGSLDEAKNCTFRPKLHAYAGDSKGAPGEEKSNFVARQEAEHRSKREDLEFQIEKAEYDALLDKKVCPSCGAKQSYDEVKEKRKKCPNCQVEYVKKLTWSKVGKQFFVRTKECAAKAAEEKLLLRKSVDESYKISERRQFDPSLGRIVVVKEGEVGHGVQWNDDVEKEFFARMEEKLRRREEKKKLVAEKIYSEKCPFEPAKSSRTSRSRREDGYVSSDSDDGGEVVGRFLRRVETDLEERRQNYPQKFAKKKPVEDTLAFK